MTPAEVTQLIQETLQLEEKAARLAIQQKIDGKKLLDYENKNKLFNLLIEDFGMKPDCEKEIRYLQWFRYLVRTMSKRRLVSQNLFAWGSNYNG